MITGAHVAAQPLLANAATLALRQDDPLSLIFILKTMGVLVLLLALAYLALRWYASRYSTGVAKSNRMRCVEELRLSVKTKAYLLDVEGAHILIVDGASGTSIVQIEAKATGPGDQ